MGYTSMGRPFHVKGPDAAGFTAVTKPLATRQDPFLPERNWDASQVRSDGGFYPSLSADGLMKKDQRSKRRLLFSYAFWLVRASRNRRAFTASALTWARSPPSRHSTTSGP